MEIVSTGGRSEVEILSTGKRPEKEIREQVDAIKIVAFFILPVSELVLQCVTNLMV